jgi:alpha-1,2-mannosyltransferase
MAASTPFPRSRKLLVLFVIGAVIAAYVQWTYIPIHNHPFGLFHMQLDMDIYRKAAAKWADGHSVYDGFVTGSMLYTYTPFSILVLQPLGWLTKQHAVYLWSAAILATMWWVIVASFRSLGYRYDWRLGLSSLCLVSICSLMEPVRTTIWYSQINVFLMAIVLWDLLRPEGSRLRGIGVGIAAGIKLTPAFFVAYLIIARQWKAAVVAVVTFAATVVIGFLAMPRGSWKYWTTQAFDSDRVFPTDRVPSNQSVKGMLAEVFDTNAPSNAVWLPCALIAAALGLCAAWLAHRRGQELLALTLTGMTTCAVSPFSWGHHWVWFTPLAVYAIHLAITSGRRTVTDVQWGRPARWLPLLLALVGLVALYLSVFCWRNHIAHGVQIGPRWWPHGWYGMGLFMVVTPDWTRWFTAQSYLWVFAVTSIAAIVAWGPAAVRDLRAAKAAAAPEPVSDRSV